VAKRELGTWLDSARSADPGNTAPRHCGSELDHTECPQSSQPAPYKRSSEARHKVKPETRQPGSYGSRVVAEKHTIRLSHTCENQATGSDLSQIIHLPTRRRRIRPESGRVCGTRSNVTSPVIVRVGRQATTCAESPVLVNTCPLIRAKL